MSFCTEIKNREKAVLTEESFHGAGEATEVRSPEEILNAYRRVRSQTEALASPITPEDAQIQSMTDVSPTKWHLGHTSWFFETFLLSERAGYELIREEYRVLFNSYYNTVGKQHPRSRRGMLCRPPLADVLDYRHAVDAGVHRYLEGASAEDLRKCSGIIGVGLNHEQQHQELMLTDILHVYWTNPLRPAYRDTCLPLSDAPPSMGWHALEEGIHWIGAHDTSFAFDNEYPRHRQFLHRFDLASRLVTAGEFMQFITDSGYQRPELWLSDGWDAVQEEGWEAPLYWERRNGTWWRMTLHGMHPVDPNTAVCHVSFYEADAYARWAGVRLPTEAEWEVAAEGVPIEGNLQQSEDLVPLSPGEPSTAYPIQMYGDTWEWTQSAYSSYPGYRAGDGALGEYNGKFMCNQLVLRGASLATPVDHVRSSYRNFFHPHARWQFSGIRLARDS